MARGGRPFNGPYEGEYLSRVAFPMGGIGAGMICLEGTGALSHVSVRNAPEVFNEPLMFAAISFPGSKAAARVLEGPVPMWKAFGQPGSGNGQGGKSWGLPRFAKARFEARFPFGTVTLEDEKSPVSVRITGWSPFIPGNPDDSSLPVAALEYELTNTTRGEVDAVFSFHSANFMATRSGGEAVREGPAHGIILWQPGPEDKPWEQGAFWAAVDSAGDVLTDCAWFRRGWFDPLTMVWNTVSRGEYHHAEPYTDGPPSPGGSIYAPLRIKPGETRTVRLLMAWHCPVTNQTYGRTAERPEDCCEGCDCEQPAEQTYAPFYASLFPAIEDVARYWLTNYRRLRDESERFAKTFYDTDLPPEVVEAVAANLTILKSPTVLRQKDGRLWAWEGCGDNTGCCSGSCTHVWNYAQAICHLFPSLERTLRETEFRVSQDRRGHQTFRSALPIRPTTHEFHAAADGQLGGIMKVYREWRISGDTQWLRKLWPQVRHSLDYCIATWDPDHTGMLMEPHHNTYDIEFWGPDGMCTSFYLGALKAASEMGRALGDEQPLYGELLEKGRKAMETELFDGEYFFQKVMWEGLHASPPRYDTPESNRLLEREGPKYQYGAGCLSDGVLGAWIGKVCGVPEFLDRGKVRSHLKAVHRYNFRKDLSGHANPQRPGYAFGTEGGLLLCSWPKGGQLSLPFVYANEVWTGIEYQVASHLMLEGMVKEGLEIVRECRKRYDGRFRNPFNEYECGHWYARAMASYGLLQGLSGARYDAVEQVLYLHPSIRGDFRCFIATAGGYGTVGVRDGKPFLEVRSGEIPVKRIDYRPPS